MLKTPDNPKGVDESVLDEMIQGLQDDRPSFLAKFRKQFYGVNVLSHSVSSELLDWTTFMALNASPEATIECVHAFGRTDMRNDLKHIDVPTLIIHGKDDKTVPIEVSGEEAANGIMDAVARFYSGSLFFVTQRKTKEQVTLE